MDEIWLPDHIKKRIDGKKYQENSVGMSDSRVFVFDDMVLKIQRHSYETDNEYAICYWAMQKIPVPQILCYEICDEKVYCLMSRMKGKMACDDMYMTNPELLLDIIKKAFHMLWSVNIKDCPCYHLLDMKLKKARYNVENHLVKINQDNMEVFDRFGFVTPFKLLEWLETNRPNEKLVFSHGDFSLPNIFANGCQVSGFVDLGQAGVSDPWQDIAICYRSLKYNFEGRYNGGKSYEGYLPEMLFDKLGITLDEEKLKYYLLLDELL